MCMYILVWIMYVHTYARIYVCIYMCTYDYIIRAGNENVQSTQDEVCPYDELTLIEI